MEPAQNRSVPGALAARLRALWRETAHVFASTPRVLALVWHASPPRVAALTVLTVLQGLLPSATVWVGKLVVDGVVAAIGAGGAQESVQRLIWLVALQFALGVVGIGLGHVAALVQQALSDVVSHRLNVQVLAKANTLDLAYYETAEFYDKLRNAQRLGSQPVQLVTGGLLQLVRNVIVVASMITLLWRFHPLLPLVILAGSVPQLISQMYFGRYSWRLMHWQAPLYRKQNYLGSVMTGDAHAKEIRLFGLGDHLLGRYVESALEVLRQNWDLRSRQRRAQSLLSLLSTGVSSGTYLYIVLQAAYGRITLGDLTLYGAAVGQTQSTLYALLGGITSVYETNLQVDDLFQFLDFQPKIVSGPRRLGVPVPLRHGVEFRNVSFGYPLSEPSADGAGGLIMLPDGRMHRLPPDRRSRRAGGRASNGAAATRAGSRPPVKDVLKGVSFTIPAGKTVALVGANGAGKTTLVKLLSRLYDPTEGQVLLDGEDLRDYDLDDLRRQIGVIFQDYARYQMEARENIGFGQIEHLADTERVARAASQGGAVPVIEKLPQGYETILGRLFAGGVELSGGEWQKVALARGFMREAPQLLVLDEPTAALDAQAEFEVYERFHELTQGKTSLLISHRFSTVRMADLIVVLEHGRVTEQGSHEELSAAGGTYARLYEMQAMRYR
jgi:ATP-binding cassette subfamily B protein